MKRQTTEHCGILALDKPAGITSHDLVDIVRRATGERRVGHAGTLDPLATGLILICVGSATRLCNYLIEHDKRYKARIVFGTATDTDDAQGRIVTAYSNKAPGSGLQVLDVCSPQSVLDDILGESMQLPPAYSAIKKNGVVAYKAAREGKNLDLQARPVCIKQATLLDSGVTKVDLDDSCGGRFEAELPYWDVNLLVSKGTYIRSIARDLGQSLGCGAHIGALRRLECCCCSVDDAISVQELARIAALNAGSDSGGAGGGGAGEGGGGSCGGNGSRGGNGSNDGCNGGSRGGGGSASGGNFPWLNPLDLLGFLPIELNEKQCADIKNGKTLRAFFGNLCDAEKGGAPDNLCDAGESDAFGGQSKDGLHSWTQSGALGGMQDNIQAGVLGGAQDNIQAGVLGAAQDNMQSRPQDSALCSCYFDNKLIAVCKRCGADLKPVTVIVGGVSGVA